MKSKILAIVIFVIGLQQIAVSQSNDLEYSNLLNHEIKIDPLYLILGNLEIAYENLLTDESSVGLSVMVPFDNTINWRINYALTGYYRFHFGEGYADGFFLEGFSMLNSVQDRVERTGDFGEPFRTSKNIVDLALGLGAGYKLVSRGGVVFEIHAGVGRNLFSDENNDRNFDFIFRGGINVGYRF